MTKRVYFEPASRIHSAHWELINYPPDGYEFVVGQRVWDKAIKAIVSHNLPPFSLRWNLVKLLPVPLVKAYLERFFNRVPQGTDLTFAYNHPVFRKEAWIVYLEWAHMLTGQDARQLRRYKRVVERLLASNCCRKILTWSEPAKKSILLNLECSSFEHKIEVVPLAVHKKEFVKNYRSDKTRLLFVGSAWANSPIAFHSKGGKEVLEAFDLLNKKYADLELVIRAGVPQDIMRKYQSYNNIKFIEEPITQEALERLFASADFFLFPGHETPWGVILEAGSYELPVIATDVHANSELIQDGVTGLLIKSSKGVPYYWKNYIPSVDSPLRKRFIEAIQGIDRSVVEELVEKAGILIENPQLRREMGKAARQVVEHGRHSIEHRNRKLKAIFVEATEEALNNT